MAPTPGQLKVATDALRADSHTWDQQSGQLRQIVGKATGLTMDRLEAGVFQLYVGSYQQIVAEIVARSGEGATAMSHVAGTLVQVADNYDRTEAANRNRFHH
jgi:hypothetical protein